MTLNDSISRSSGFAVAEETSAGTAETVPAVYEYLTDDPAFNPVTNILIHRSILSRSPYQKSIASYHMEGSLNIIGEPDSIMGWLCKWGLGSVSSGTVVDGSYTHTFVPADSIKSFTTWFNRGATQKVKIPYCVVNSLNFDQSVDDALRISAGIIAKSEIEATDYGTPSYDTVYPFMNGHLAVTIGGSGTGQAAEVHKTSIAITNGIDVGAGRVHGSLFPSAFIPGDRGVTGSFDMYFNDATEYKRFWGSTSETAPGADITTVALTFTWTSSVIAGTGTTPYSLSITIPAAVYTTNSISLAGARVVQNIGFEALYDATATNEISIVLVNEVESY